MRENHYAISCIKFEGSQVFKLQDEHNASSFFLCLGKSCRYPNAKLVILLMFRIIYNGIIA